jgi:hypothetical protein
MVILRKLMSLTEKVLQNISELPLLLLQGIRKVPAPRWPVVKSPLSATQQLQQVTQALRPQPPMRPLVPLL